MSENDTEIAEVGNNGKNVNLGTSAARQIHSSAVSGQVSDQRSEWGIRRWPRVRRRASALRPLCARSAISGVSTHFFCGSRPGHFQLAERHARR